MNQQRLDMVLKGLGDANRRRILDLLKASPGLNVTELSEHFEVTRYAVMKHLKVLEEAELVVSKKEGRSRRLYFNPMPLQLVYERWVSEFSSSAAGKLTDLKRKLETETMTKHVFQLYIRTTAARLWEALTDPEQTKKYYFDTAVDSAFEQGAPISYEGEESTAIEGEIVELEPQRKLVHTFRFCSLEEPASRVVYEIEPVDQTTVQLTVTHDELDPEGATYGEVGAGWPRLLSSLKSYLETGEPLEV